MKDQQFLRLNLIKSHQRSDCISGKIHIGLRLAEQEFLISPLSKKGFCLEFRLKFEVSELFMLSSEIKKMKSDIMSGVFIVFSRISKSDQEFHSDFFV